MASALSSGNIVEVSLAAASRTQPTRCTRAFTPCGFLAGLNEAAACWQRTAALDLDIVELSSLINP